MTWLVVGAGISGLAAAKLLKQRGETVMLSDIKPPPEKIQKELDQFKIKTKIGPQEESLLNGVTGIIQSPGLPPDLPLFVAARKTGIPIRSEIDLALKSFKGELVAITGTNGKSTTTAMTAHILTRAGKTAVAAGNIGRPPSDFIRLGEEYEVWVLELSSYQIETSQDIKAKVASFTSFTPDHLNRHKNLAGYFKAKWRLFLNLPADGLALLSQEAYDAATLFKETIPNCRHQKMIQSLDAALFNEAPIWTKHDFLNASFALEAASFLTKKAIEELIPCLDDFEPLAHRCEKVGTLSGEIVINDSKSTNVEATVKALESIDKPCLLFLGGQGKDESFTPLGRFSDKIGKVICFGQSGDLIQSQLPGEMKTERFNTLKAALAELKKNHSNLKLPILFSPGCASFDEFNNFEERGAFFKSELSSILD